MNLILEDIKKVVEWHLRNTALYKDTIENGWKDTIDKADGSPVTLPSNLKDFRDMIASIILDVLTAVGVSGDLSAENNEGTVSRTEDTSKIELDKPIVMNEGSTKIAKDGEDVAIDGTLLTWLNGHTHGGGAPDTPFAGTSAGAVNGGTSNIKVDN